MARVANQVRLTQGAVLLLLLGCQQRPPQPPVVAPPTPPTPTLPSEAAQPPRTAELERLTWTAYSKDGKVIVTQTASDATHCVVTSTGGAVAWKVDTCLGDALSTWFVNPTGATVLRFDTIATGGKDTWKTTPVVTFVNRGVPSTFATAGDLVNEASKLVFFGGHFAWAQGTGGLTDQPEPALAADGLGVDGTSADGRPFHFGFDGPSLRAVPMKPGEPPTTTLQRTEDDPPPLGQAVSPPANRVDMERPRPVVDTCALGREAVARAEQAVRTIEQAPPAVNPCMKVLQRQGAEAYALCMGAQHATPDPQAGLEAARAALERAQETLRRAQVSGCR